jgi:2-polyprenyl-3-methyl-5-hydroxy-6-metoxy-1,4-benzoquinol methylase
LDYELLVEKNKIMAYKVQFKLPPEGLFKPNDELDDPLPYYYRPLVGKLYKRRIQLGLNLLSKKYGNVLEFGYGSGLLLPSLAPISISLFGIDITSEPDVVNETLNKLNIKANLKKGDITKANYPDQSFDLIVGFSVFEHIADPDEILSEMHRILKPGGNLLVGMPRVDKTMSKMFSLIGFNNIDDHHVKNHQDFIQNALKYFVLVKRNRLPGFVPGFLGLYFNMLFSKK